MRTLSMYLTLLPLFLPPSLSNSVFPAAASSRHFLYFLLLLLVLLLLLLFFSSSSSSNSPYSSPSVSSPPSPPFHTAHHTHAVFLVEVHACLRPLFCLLLQVHLLFILSLSFPSLSIRYSFVQILACITHYSFSAHIAKDQFAVS